MGRVCRGATVFGSPPWVDAVSRRRWLHLWHVMAKISIYIRGAGIAETTMPMGEEAMNRNYSILLDGLRDPTTDRLISQGVALNTNEIVNKRTFEGWLKTTANPCLPYHERGAGEGRKLAAVTETVNQSNTILELVKNGGIDTGRHLAGDEALMCEAVRRDPGMVLGKLAGSSQQ